jgi:hypothetical protein
MMIFDSVIETRGSIGVFPQFMAERVYMKEFYKDKGLPPELSRWQDTVDAMLDGVDTDGPIYLMVDEGFIQSGATQRRKGLHIDGYWNPGISAHGNNYPDIPSHHQPVIPRGHRAGRQSDDGHKATRFLGKWDVPGQGWSHSDFKEPEAIILASSLSAARGYVGTFEGPIGEGGDCSHIDLSDLTEIQMHAHQVYACNVTGLHESLPVGINCQRQLVRLNVPGWSPTTH